MRHAKKQESMTHTSGKEQARQALGGSPDAGFHRKSSKVPTTNVCTELEGSLTQSEGMRDDTVT